ATMGRDFPTSRYASVHPSWRDLRHPVYGSHEFADAVERAQPKVLQGRIRRDPQGLSRSSNSAASCRLPDKPSIYPRGAASGWEAHFSRIRRATLLSCRNTVAKSATATVILKLITRGSTSKHGPCCT